MERPKRNFEVIVTNSLQGDYITVAQAANILNRESSWIRRLVYKKQLNGKKLGHDWLIEKKSTLEFVPRKKGRPKKTN